MIDERPRLLGLPVESRLRAGVGAVALFAFYATTMSRSLSLYDSPELALVAEQLGLGHPFGQPLHTLLGALVSRLPGIDPLVALNGLSALFGALCLIPATSLAETLILFNRGRRTIDTRFVAPTCFLAGMLPSLWEPATRVEVYVLAVFFALWAIARVADAILRKQPERRAFFTSGLALGFGASANPVCAFGAALAALPSLLLAAARGTVAIRHFVALALGGLAGLLPYLYVFLVADRRDVLIWGAPTDGEGIRRYFTAADFAPKQVDGWEQWRSHVWALIEWSFRSDPLWVLAPLGLTGWALIARPRGLGLGVTSLAWLFFVGFVARNGVFAPEVLDYLGYLALPAWLTAAGLGVFFGFLGARRALFGMGGLGVLLAALLVASPRIGQRTRSVDRYTETLAFEALSDAPVDGIVIVEQDHWVGPMWYLQQRLGIRSDVVVVAYGLASSSWYWQQLYDQHRDLRAFEVRGPGGRDARIRRFLEAQTGRAIQIERVPLGGRLGLPTCPADWLVDVAPVCAPSSSSAPLAEHAAGFLERLGTGSPGTDELIALVTMNRGYDLVAHGFARAAIDMLLSGVPAPEGSTSFDLSSVPERIDPRAVPYPSYEPPVALGDPARNAHYASVIAHVAGDTTLASRLERLSADLGGVSPNFADPRHSPANL